MINFHTEGEKRVWLNAFNKGKASRWSHESSIYFAEESVKEYRRKKHQEHGDGFQMPRMRLPVFRMPRL